MKSTNLTVVLNMSRLSIPEKINKALSIHNAIKTNAAVFATPNPSLTDVLKAITELETAWHNAQDGGKSLTAIMHDKEENLMRIITNLAHYVEGVCKNDIEIIHLAKLDVRKTTSRTIIDFEIEQLDHSGAVGLRVKARKGVFYKWQYTLDPLSSTSVWTTAKTTNTASTEIENLTVGSKYWFRVLFVDAGGEIANNPLSLIIN